MRVLGRPVADGDAGAGGGVLRLRAVELSRTGRARRAGRRRARPQLAGDADAVSGAAGALAARAGGRGRGGVSRTGGRAGRARAAGGAAARDAARRGGDRRRGARCRWRCARTSIGACCRSRRRCRRCACRRSWSARFGERDRALIVLVEDADRDARARARRRVAAARSSGCGARAWCAATRRRARCFPSPATQAARRARLEHAMSGGTTGRARRLTRRARATAGFDAAPFEPFLQQLADGAPPLTLDDPAARELGFLVRAHVHDDAHGRDGGDLRLPGAGAEPSWRRRCATSPPGPPAAWSPARRCSKARCCALLTRDTLRVTVGQRLAVALLLALYYRRWRPWLAVMLPLSLAWICFARRARRARPAAQPVQPARRAAGDRLRHRRSHLPRPPLRGGAGARRRRTRWRRPAAPSCSPRCRRWRASPGWPWRASTGCASSACRARWRCCSACSPRSRCLPALLTLLFARDQG